jgi:hypothetical protein
MMREYLSEFVKIEPFSVETLSGGRAQLFHPAMVASSVKILTGFASGLNGISLFLKKVTNSARILSLNDLLNGPTYETKDDASKTSPMIT